MGSEAIVDMGTLKPGSVCWAMTFWVVHLIVASIPDDGEDVQVLDDLQQPALPRMPALPTLNEAPLAAPAGSEQRKLGETQRAAKIYDTPEEELEALAKGGHGTGGSDLLPRPRQTRKNPERVGGEAGRRSQPSCRTSETSRLSQRTGCRSGREVEAAYGQRPQDEIRCRGPISQGAFCSAQCVRSSQRQS